MTPPLLPATVAICTRNRATLLARTLESLARQVYDSRWRVIVVDNASGDDTRALVATQARDFPVPLELVREERIGADHARNRALAAADTPVLAFLDDDNECLPGWLHHLADAFADPAVGAAAGRIFPLLPPAAPAWARRMALETGGPTARYDFGIEEGDIRLSEQPPPFGGNMALRVAAAREVGGFSTRFGYGRTRIPGEDTEIGRRLARAGWRLVYRPGAVSLNRVQPGQIQEERVAEWWQGYGQAEVLQEQHGLVAVLRLAWRCHRHERRHLRRLRWCDARDERWRKALVRCHYYRGRRRQLLGSLLSPRS